MAPVNNIFIQMSILQIKDITDELDRKVKDALTYIIYKKVPDEILLIHALEEEFK